MPIFSSGPFGAWRTPSSGESPLVAARTTSTGDHELTIRLGADIGDLVAVLTSLPADAFFTEHYGDVDAILVFRPVPGVPATAPAGDTPPAGPAAAHVTAP